jgi:hypothetical protein
MRHRVRPFWYLSKAKLDALATDVFPWTERFGAKVNLGVEAIGVEAALAPKSAGDDTETQVRRKLRKVEKSLRRRGSVREVNELEGRPATFFRYHGPSIAIVQPDLRGFFLATVIDQTAILLCGWAGHAVGAETESADVISPSAAPIQTMVALAEREGGPGDADASFALSYSWAMLFARGLQMSPTSSWPLTTGIALYAGQTKPDADQIERSTYDGTVDTVVVGSPIYVEQIDAEQTHK